MKIVNSFEDDLNFFIYNEEKKINIKKTIQSHNQFFWGCPHSFTGLHNK